MQSNTKHRLEVHVVRREVLVWQTVLVQGQLWQLPLQAVNSLVEDVVFDVGLYLPSIL